MITKKKIHFVLGLAVFVLFLRGIVLYLQNGENVKNLPGLDMLNALLATLVVMGIAAIIVYEILSKIVEWYEALP